MTVEIVHPVTADDVGAMYSAAVATYLENPTGREVFAPWRRRTVDPALCWMAREHGRVVGTLRTIEDTMSVPGVPGGPTEVIDADLLSLVSVSATHRRQGLLTRMLDESLTEAHDLGKPVSILVAAEWPIYGRFGYAPAVFEARHRIHRWQRGAVLRSPRAPGSLREVDALAAADLAPPVYDAELALRAGIIGRSDGWWDRQLGRLGPDREVVQVPDAPYARHVVHMDAAGRTDGYVRWSVVTDQDEATGGGVLRIEELIAADPAASAELWRFVLGIDLISRIEADARPVDDPLTHLLVDGRAVTSKLHDAMWLRILDVSVALSARRYATADELTIEVVDETVGGWAGGRFTLSTDADGRARCVPARGRSVDLTLPQATLASVYLGGVRGAVLGRAGGMDEHTPGAARRFDLLFATPLAPWRATDF